ncbi:alpha/beta hydrolase family protein [Ampullimonas aquatilis]|uniref:alpha/beta hydrolase family protein n=1 Tax=Ampullimonas aquatilis TaxID=1341549 RepID=UPI003C73E5D0
MRVALSPSSALRRKLFGTLSAICAAGLLPTTVQANSVYEQSGTYSVNVIDQVWRDTSRNRDVPIKLRIPQSERKLPVILFSHGLGGSTNSGKLWGEHWASHGYIVIHVQHKGSDESVWQGKPGLDAAMSMKSAANPMQLIERTRDIKFILDSLTKRVATPGDHPLQYADLAHIGMAGHSFGAITTQAIAGQQMGPFGNRAADARIGAAIAFSPSPSFRNTGGNPFAKIERPFFSMTGTLDGELPGGLGTAAVNRTKPFEMMPAGNKYLVVFKDADHMIFSGQNIETTTRSKQARNPASMSADKHVIKAGNALSIAFWNAYLKSDEAARNWLQKQAGEVLNYDDHFSSK